MGQKVNPVGLRLGINRTWDSRWFAARGEYGKLLHEDRAIRAAQEALSSPLLNDSDIKGAKFVLLNIALGDRQMQMD